MYSMLKFLYYFFSDAAGSSGYLGQNDKTFSKAVKGFSCALI